MLVVFQFGRHAYGWLAGFLAAATLAVAFLHVRDSHFAMLDIPLALAITAGLYVAYRTIFLSGRRPLLLNGVSLGIATSLKYNGAILFLAMAAAQWLRTRADHSPLIRAALRLGGIGVIGVATLAITSPFLVLDPGLTQHGLGYIVQHLGTATAPAIGWVELAAGLWFGIDPVLVLMGAIGVAYGAWRRQPADWILLGFLLPYYLLIGSGGSVFFRRRLVGLRFAGDEADAALVGEVVEGPVGEHDQAVAEADQVDDVDEKPAEPGEPPAEVEAEGVEQGVAAADGG